MNEMIRNIIKILALTSVAFLIGLKLGLVIK